MEELTREFLIESQEGLDRMERCLTDLEERPAVSCDGNLKCKFLDSCPKSQKVRSFGLQAHPAT